MCGIAGAVSRDGRPVDEAAVRRATGALRHRGPDDEGGFASPDGTVRLGHRRLSVIDVAGGHQPLRNEDGSVQLVLNGEIYNYRELRAGLEGRGHRFATASDAETLVHLYEEEGEAAVGRLRGMFAFALWDGARRRLVLARDRLGKKPLVYGERGGVLAFASELGALRAGWGAGELDREALDAYLALGAVPAPLTIDAGWRKLEPATLLVVDEGRAPRLERYWEPRAAPKLAVTREEALERVREKLVEATRLRLASEVPLGLFLSGGVDSSAVLWAMSQAAPGRVKSFAIGFDEPSHDESAHARTAARALGAEHVELRAGPATVELLDQVLAAWSEPFADSSCVPTWLLARLARAHVTVALTGDGGDELFAGYPRYRLAERLSRAARFVPRPLAAAAARLPRAGRLRRPARAAELLALDDAGRAFELASVFGTRLRRRLLVPDAAPPGVGERIVRTAFERAGGGLLDRLLGTDLRTYLPDDLLVKMDIATMAHGLEARSPLLDHELVELALRLPAELKRTAGRSKALLKDAVAPAFPPGFLERPKQGFAVPLRRWIRDDVRGWFEAELRDGALARSGLVRRREVLRLLREERAGRAAHQHRIFALVALSRFLGRRGSS